MIIVLHGDDLSASYNHLQGLLTKFPKAQKVRLTDKHTKDDLINHALTKDIFETEKIIICENFLTQKIDKNLIKKLPESINVIFWEYKQVPAAILSKLKSYAKIEIFKSPPQLFWFLDALTPDSKKTLFALAKLENPENLNLIFHLANRLQMLIFAKIQLTYDQVRKITSKPMADWQWQKHKNQARLFDLKTLKNLLSGILKIDSIIKSGQTSLSPSTLISVLLTKYLPM